MRMWIVVALAAIGCEGKKNPQPAAGSVGSQVVAAAPSDAAPPMSADAPIIVDASSDAAPGDAALANAHTLNYDGILDWEAIGPLRLGLEEAKVTKLLGAPKKKAFPVEEGATGMFVSNWEWPAQGLNVEMSSDRRTGPFRVRSIEVYSPSTLATSRGAKIGTTLAELPALYVRNVDEGRDEPNEYLVGSTYGGMLFTLKDDKVVSIFLGAMAF